MISPAPWLALRTVGISTSPLVEHLWQSTLFAFAAWLLTLALRRNHARTRYRLWMLASVKFLVPFSILVAAGHSIYIRMGTHAPQPALSTFVNTVAQPFLVGSDPNADVSSAAAPIAVTATAAHHFADWLPLLLVVLWASGALFLFARWARSWWLLRAAARVASSLASISGVPVLLTPTRIEPGVFGILRPALLLPQGIAERLNASQMDAILAHELCHVRRRDNLTAALHMLVEALFWFHPAVWWIRANLLEERERACDEAVLASRREALVYAEGILNVCKFYVEAPLNCVSGVTGSDLKKRIARIMAEHVARKLDGPRKLLLLLAALLAIGLPLTFGFVHAASAQAQPAPQKTGIEGTWQGTLHAPNVNLRTVLKITKTPAGVLSGTFYSIDQGGQGIATSSISFDGGVLKYAIQQFDLTYQGKLSADGNSITGASIQGGNSLPLVFERATPETEWAIPEPRPQVPPMPDSADPGVEVATIKPARPDEQRKGFVWNGRELQIMNFTLSEIMCAAYNLQPRQIAGAPDWVTSDKFDITVQPDIPGRASLKQSQSMTRKLMADRFQLKFHRDKKEMSAYVLTVIGNAPKMTQNTGDASAGEGLFFGPIGTLHVRNAPMADFAQLLQSALLDRPVVDQTGLPGRWDFTLKWTPDDAQFAAMGAKAPPPSTTDAADAPPQLLTAIREQLGLKLEAAKTPVDVVVIDHVDHPSPN